MKETELKPCPFCGSEAEIIDTHAYLDKAIRIGCSECRTTTKRILIDHPQLKANGLDESTRYTREQAINEAAKIWNRRAEE